MTAGHLYRELLGSLALRLGPSGFRGAGRTFRRNMPEVSHLVAVQKSVSSDQDRMKFTLNVGVWSRDVSLATGRGDKPPTSVGWCHLDARVGRFTPSMRDVWWDVYDEGDLVAACAQAEALLLDRVVPALGRMTTAEELLHEWLEGEPFLKPGIDYERYVELLRTAVESRRP